MRRNSLESPQINTNLFSAMKEVSIKVPTGNWTTCGGTIKKSEKIKIKISDEVLGTECFTNPKEYEVGNDIVWHTHELMLDSDCAEMKIDPVNSRLQGVIIQGVHEKHCIKILNVVLDDALSTTYKKDPESNNLNKV